MHNLSIVIHWNHLIDPVATVLIFVFYFLTSIVTFRHWYDYSNQCYKNKKISYVDKAIITTLITILVLPTVILDLLFAYFSVKAQDYFFYAKSIDLHDKVTQPPSASYIDIVYLYKLMIVMVIVQCILAFLPLIVIQTMKFVRRKQKVAIND